MKHIARILIGGVLAAGMILPASGQITLSLSPDSQKVTAGQDVTYDLNISGLFGNVNYSGPALGGFDVELDYSSVIASAQSVAFGTKLNLSGSDFQYSDLSTPGVIDLAEISFDSAAALEAAQSSSFTLATITLEGTGKGTETLRLGSYSLTDANGTTIGHSVPELGCYEELVGALALGLCGLGRKFTRTSRS